MSYDDACKFVEDIAACRWVHIRGACAGSFLDFEDVASSAEDFNVIAVECLVFALMCLKPCDQNCIHCVFLAAGHGLLAAGTHAIHPILFCVAMCMLQVRALQAVLETSGSAFPEAMMGRRESSERYLPKIIIEKSQK